MKITAALLTDVSHTSRLAGGKKSVWKECQAYSVQMIELSLPTNTATCQHWAIKLQPHLISGN